MQVNARMSLMRRWKKKSSRVKNIVIFISDALRWDYLPKHVSKLGVTFKTIASGTFTPVSFSSMLTGLYPPHHGVHSFLRGRLPVGIGSLFSLGGYNDSLWTPNSLIRWFGGFPPIYRVLGQRKRIPLNEIEPPFLYLEKDKGGHCPYGRSGILSTCQSFFRKYGQKDEKALRKKYEEGIERSVQVFKNRMRTLEERELLEETLVIFSSDHGELLGEHGGIVGHSMLTTPEIVYVPTVLIHPNLPRDVSFEDEGVLRHIDLYPTISDLLCKKVTNRIDGISIFNIDRLPESGLTYHITHLKGNYSLKETSIWDKDGGYIFREGNPILRLLRALWYTILSNDSIIAIYQRERLRKLRLSRWTRNCIEVIESFCSSTVKYGNPAFSSEEAKAFVQNGLTPNARVQAPRPHSHES